MAGKSTFAPKLGINSSFCTFEASVYSAYTSFPSSHQCPTLPTLCGPQSLENNNKSAGVCGAEKFGAAAGSNTLNVFN